jgi:uncharacterized protein DUF3800
VTGTALPIVYADETYNTGENLLDPDQPVFVVAGLHLDDELADDIVNDVKKTRQKHAGEPKYSILSKRPAGRAILMSALRRLPEGSARVVVAHKRYMIIAKIVDLGVEPLMFDLGYNMYADGSAKSLANLLHAICPVVGDSERYNDVLDSFVKLARGTADAGIYSTAVDNYLATIQIERFDPIEFALKTPRFKLEQMVSERHRGLHTDTLDPAIPAVVSLCESFVESLGSIRLVHDHSAVIGRNTELLLKVNELTHLVDPDRKIIPVYENWVREIDLDDSKSVTQLQIVDWVAGATRDVVMSRIHPASSRVVTDELGELVDTWLAGDIWPDFESLKERFRIS